MSYHLSPVGNSAQIDANGDPLSGGKILTYIAGTSTPATTYTDDSGGTAQANPVVLNASGLPANPIWLQSGVTYKFVFSDAKDVLIRTVDDISGINDVTGSLDQWVTYPNAVTYISATSFSVAGDQTGTFQVWRRLKSTNTAGTVYSTVVLSAFAAGVTTVTVANSSGALDLGLSSVSYGLLSSTNDSVPRNLLTGRNKIINGKMEVAQRGTSFAAAAFGAYTVDRWGYFGAASTAVVTVSQQSDAPSDNEFQYSLRAAVTTADAAIAAGDVVHLAQVVEGFNARDLINRSFVVSFRVRSSKTGTHCVAFRNSGTDRSYVTEYSVSAANTWETKSVSVPAGLITAGTWNWTNGVGLTASFVLAAGTTFQTTANAWQTGNYLATANQVNCLDTIGNIFAITGVQLEVGPAATTFEHRPYAHELALCQHYYYRTSASSGPIGMGLVNTTTTALAVIAFPVTMRTAPSALEQSGTATDYRIRTSGGTLTTCSAAPSYVNATNGSATVQFNVASGLTAGQAAIAESINANSYLGFSAEL